MAGERRAASDMPATRISSRSSASPMAAASSENEPGDLGLDDGGQDGVAPAGELR